MMHCFSRLPLAVLTLLLLALFLPANPAHAQTTGDVDAKLQVFLEAAVRGIEGQDVSEIQSMIVADPVGAKFVFARCCFLVAQAPPGDTSGEVYWALAKIMAAGIEGKLGDPTPGKILLEMEGDRSKTPPLLNTFVASLGDARRLTYEESLSFAPGYFNEAALPSLPLYIKALRFGFAKIVASPALVVQELDTYPQVLPLVEDGYRKAGLTEADVKATFQGITMKFVMETIELSKKAVLTEYGLATPDKAQTEEPFDFPLAGFRISYRANRLDRAERCLADAKMYQRLAGSTPVFSYVVATNEFQLRLLKGERPGPRETVAEFERAWSKLDGYQPFVNIKHDLVWDEGRLATRFWLAQLSRDPSVSRGAVKELLGELLLWNDARAAVAGRIFALGKGDLLLAATLLQGFTMSTFAITDQITVVVERFPDLLPELGASNSDLTTDVRSMVGAIVAVAGELGLTDTGPGFPPYDLDAVGLLPELLGRADLIDSRQPGLAREKRLALLEEASRYLERTGSLETEAAYLLELGAAYKELGDSETALRLWQEALRLADSLGYVHLSLQASTLAADELARKEQWVDAARLSDIAGQRLEDADLLTDSQSADPLRVARLAVKAHLRAGQPAEALAAITRGKGVQTAVLRLAADDDAKGAVQAIGDKKREVALLDSQVARLQAMPVSATRDDLLKQTEQLLADTRADFLVKSREIRQKFPTLYSAVLRFDPLDLSAIQKGLAEDTAVVQYFATDEALYIFVVTRDAFRLRSVAVNVTELDRQVNAFSRALRRNKAADAALASSGQWLHQTLVEPVTADIAGKSTLILIPSGRLNILPFAALTGPDGKSLLDSARLIELAKATDLNGIGAGQGQVPQSVVAFANATGDLPAAAKEGEEIAALFPAATVYQGKEATRQNFLAHGAEGDILHLATHGEWNLDDSLQNYLSMAGQEKVGQQEIFELALDHTSLVILSACNTAMGDGGEVKFVASLAEAFWIAGSSSVVASLWAVNDESTALLMAELYKGLQAGVPKAEALRKAQLAVRSDPQYSHPYYWSGFVLFGQWR